MSNYCNDCKSFTCDWREKNIFVFINHAMIETLKLRTELEISIC